MNLQPTYTGYVANTQDALILFQATISGRLPAVSRRPHDRERTELVRSGSVFVFNEQTSGIKRWTDGIAWSPSRILGNFLVYRQLEKPFTPGEKKQTNKRSRRKRPSGSSPYSGGGARVSPSSAGSSAHIDEDIKYAGAPGSVTGSSLPIQIDLPNQSMEDASAAPVERSLVGSLVDSYGFKKDGLIKKTMSIIVGGQPHHLVSYYKPDDVLSGVFETPSNSQFLKDLPISDELTQRQNFRVPLDNAEGGHMPRQGPGAHQQAMPYMGQPGAPGGHPQQPPQGYDMPFDVDMNRMYRAGQHMAATGHPSMPPNYAAAAGYRQLPPNQQQFMAPDFYSPMGSQFQQQQQQANRLPATTSAGLAPTAAPATAGYSPSLPPLSQQQSYSYGAYPHEYHLDPSGSGQNDPRRLPDAQSAAAAAAQAAAATVAASPQVAAIAGTQPQGFSPRPMAIQPADAAAVPHNYAYGYGYPQGQPW